MSAHTHYVQVDRYEEYPKMRELIQRKDSLVAQRATPAFFMQVNYPAFPPTCLKPLGKTCPIRFHAYAAAHKDSVSLSSDMHDISCIRASRVATMGRSSIFKTPCSSSPLEKLLSPCRLICGS